MIIILINIIGWTGAALVLIAYALVSTGRLVGDSVTYQMLNAIGAILLIMNSFYFGAYPSVGVNIVWIGIALFTLVRVWRKK